jgi:hypothetical protein
MIALSTESDNATFKDISNRKSSYRFCANSQYGTCNWLIPEGSQNELCIACQLNRTIPSLSGENLARWDRIEVAKHRLVYTLLRLKLPVKPKYSEKDKGLAFDFLADTSAEKRVMTGHNGGVITLNIEEADEDESTKNKVNLGERYRTLLGHFRHEIGHYYWETHIKHHPNLYKFRELFGDESVSYKDSLQSYYKNGAPANWEQKFISPYATAHPWEDWAESWAHYLHLMDTLETAYYFGIGVNPGLKSHTTEIDTDPFTIKDYDKILKMWLPLTFSVNSLNRSMGHQDFYPFVIGPKVVEKLKFIHDLCYLKERSNFSTL